MRPRGPSRRPSAARGLLFATLLAGLASACDTGGAGGETPRARASLERGLAALEAGDRRGALSDLKTTVERAPDWEEGWRTLGHVARICQDHAANMQAQRFLLERHPDDAAAARSLTDAALLAGDPDAAREGLVVLDRVEADDVETQLLHARLAFELGDMKPAAQHAKRVLNELPDQVQALSIHAVASDELGHPKLAETEYLRVIELDPGHLGARDRLARLLSTQGRDAEAAPHRAIHAKLTVLMDRSFKRRTGAERAEVYEELCELLPGWVAGRVELARARLEAGQPELAQAPASECLALRKGDPTLHELMAEVLRARGKPKAAEKQEALAAQLRRP